MKNKNILLFILPTIFYGCGNINNSDQYPVSQPTNANIYQKPQTTTSNCVCKTNKNESKVQTNISNTNKVKKTTTTKNDISINNTNKDNESKNINQKKNDIKIDDQKVQTIAENIYLKALDRMKSINTFKTDLVNYSKGYFYRKERVTEAKIATSTMQITFQRPRKTFMKIIDSPNAKSLVNTKMYCDGGEDVKIRVPGILGLFSFTFPVDKPELTGNRSYNLKDIDPVNLEIRLNDKNADIKLIGTSKIDNEDIYLLEVTNIKHLDSEIVKEILGIKKSDYSLVIHEMYDKNEVVFKNEFKNFIYNPNVIEDDFKV